MNWWTIWTKLWTAVDQFSDALNGATAKLRAHCNLPTVQAHAAPAIEDLAGAPGAAANGKAKRVLAKT